MFPFPFIFIFEQYTFFILLNALLYYNSIIITIYISYIPTKLLSKRTPNTTLFQTYLCYKQYTIFKRPGNQTIF